MLNRVDPLRHELQTLEKQAETTRIKGDEINKIINELEASINKYKEEYALLISEANAIKADLETVEAKVQRGVMLQLKLYIFVLYVNDSLSGKLLPWPASQVIHNPLCKSSVGFSNCHIHYYLNVNFIMHSYGASDNV